MNEQVKSEPQPQNPSELKKKLLAGAVAAGIAIGGTSMIAGSDRNESAAAVDASADDTAPESTTTSSTLPESLPADPTKLVIPIETSTTTTTLPEAPTTTMAPQTSSTVIENPQPQSETSSTVIENPNGEKPTREEQKQAIQEYLTNHAVGDEVTCLASNRSLEAGAKVKDLDGNQVTLEQAVDVMHPSLNTSPEDEQGNNDIGLFFVHKEQVLYMPLSNEEITNLNDSMACKVTAVNEQKQITSFSIDGQAYNEPALIAVAK